MQDSILIASKKVWYEYLFVFIDFSCFFSYNMCKELDILRIFMETVTDINIAEKTIKRLLTRLKTEPVEIYPGYNPGLTLPSGTRVSIVASIAEILPLCKFDKKSDVFVSFIVYPVSKDIPMFEIVLKKSGHYVYKNNKKFENPPLFDELFNMVWQMQQQKIKTIQETKPNSSDIKTAEIQSVILNYIKKCNTL